MNFIEMWGQMGPMAKGIGVGSVWDEIADMVLTRSGRPPRSTASAMH